jgi:hypothetical protein
MPIRNTGSDSFDDNVAAMHEDLQQQRSGVLDTMVDVHVGLGLLAGVEANRLAQKHGADDPRVQLLRDRSEAAAARVNALSVEQEIAAVRTPPPPSTGAVIQGRITDVTQRAAGRVSVQLIDEKGQPAAGVDTVDADDAGYFAFQLKPETVSAIGANTKLTVLVRAGDTQLVPAAAKPVTVAPGATVLQEVALNTAELERLRLRIPVAVSTVTVTSPIADTSAADKAAADKAAADKAATDKAAADKAAAAKAAADKAAADKAAADKAAADKAAADKAAAYRAAAAKAAADKAAADKAAADKTVADKAAADKAAADRAAAAKAAADKAAADKAAADKTAADKAAADKAAADRAAAAKAAADKAAADKAAADKSAPNKPAAKPRGGAGGRGKP